MPKDGAVQGDQCDRSDEAPRRRPAIKADLRANLQAAKDEIEALQTGKTDFGHQHVLADVTDSGALASKDVVQSDDVAAAAITTAKLAAAAVGSPSSPMRP